MRIIAAFVLLLAAVPARADDNRQRPLIDGTVLSHPSADGHFRIWYTLDGGDALTDLAGDEDPANGVPDAVDVVEEGLSRCWELFVDQQGWRPPGDDEGEGGDSRLDVYMRHIDHNGLASHEWHDDHWAAYLQIEPDVAEMGGDLMASVAAHELHHAIQYSYTVDPHTWVHEASATYAQYLIYSETVAVTAALQLLWALRLEDPSIGLDTTGDRQEYAGLVWVKFLVDRGGGDLSIFRLWWEILSEDPDWQTSISTLALQLGDDDACSLFAEYGEWLYFGCARNDDGHWLDDGLDCIMDIGAALDQEGIVPPETWTIDALEPFGFSLNAVDLDPGEASLVLGAQGSSSAAWAVRVVPLADGEGFEGTTGQPDGEGEIALLLDLDTGADQLLVVLASCAETDSFDLSIGDVVAGDDDDTTGQESGTGDGGCQCAAIAPGRIDPGFMTLLVWGVGRARRRASAPRDR